VKKILILGAHGQIARVAAELFQQRDDVELTLYLRNSQRLRSVASNRCRVVDGDVLTLPVLQSTMTGQDVVYANLDGQLELQAKNIVKAMHDTGVKRLIFVSSMGIYNEVPGEKYGAILDPYRKSAAIIEASDLEYTLLRPAWLNDKDEIDYETTQKGEPFRGSSVSRKSVADLVVKLAMATILEVRCSLGVSKPVVPR
jgi:uncharacterized protein YbjT (DUF2867 family)